jgi:hypothetical protein
MNEKEHLIVPQYLNQKIVFDMLAIIEDGFSQMSIVNKSNNEQSEKNANISGEIGTQNILSFLKLRLKSDLSFNSKGNQTEGTAYEKIHTPVSLFEKLLKYLNEKSMIKNINDINQFNSIVEGDFVIFHGNLKKNPIIEVMDSFLKLAELSSINDKNTNKKNNQSNLKGIINLMKELIKSLTLGNMVDLICENNDSKIKVILPVYYDYFFNKNMNEIIDGKFNILGKVIKINTESENYINLLRNTSFNLMKQTSFIDMFKIINQNQNIKNLFDLPKLETKIPGPSLMLIPIAIYL